MGYIFKKINLLSKKISYQLAFSYLVFIIPSYFVIYFVFDYLSTSYIIKKDHFQIESQIQIYQEAFEQKGLEGIQNLLENSNTHSSYQYLVVVSNNENEIVLFHLPHSNQAFDLKKIKQDIIVNNLAKNMSWFFLASAEEDYDAIEAKTIQLNDHFKLIVGSNTNFQDDLIDNFHKIFIYILFPIIVISIFGSIFIAQKVLNPIVKLKNSMSEVKKGQLSFRTELPVNKNELFDLTNLFNEMIDQIDNLVLAMRDTIDNIAHDLKTPLTRNRIAPELALQKMNY